MIFRILFFVFIAGNLFGQSRKEIVIATYQYADNTRVKNIQPFADHFSALTKKKTKVVSYPTVHKLIEAMKKSEVDIAFINTFGFLLYRDQSTSFSIAANLKIPDKDASTYQTILVSSDSSGIKDLKTLVANAKQLSLLLVNPGSTSGNLVPRLKLAEFNLASDSDFKSVTYTQNHALTLQQIAANKADVGAFGSEEYYKAIKKDSTIAKKVNVIWESAPIPLGPVMYRKNLPSEDVAYLLKILLQLHQQNPQALEAIKNGWTEAKNATQLQVIDDRYYYQILNLNSKSSIELIKKFVQ
jgi:phosphonate transport system substrate-binding protein